MDEPKPRDDHRTAPHTDPGPASAPSAAPPPAPARRRGAWLGRLLWTVVLLLIVGSVAWWIHTRPAAAPARRGRGAGPTGPSPVVAAPAGKTDIRIRLYALGTVTPLATVTVKTQINGQLMHLDFV